MGVLRAVIILTLLMAVIITLSEARRSRGRGSKGGVSKSDGGSSGGNSVATNHNSLNGDFNHKSTNQKKSFGSEGIVEHKAKIGSRRHHRVPSRRRRRKSTTFKPSTSDVTASLHAINMNRVLV